MSGGYVKSVGRLIDRVRPFAATVRTRHPRWISTPDGDQGEEWCADCGYFKVRNLRRKDRRRRDDYILDGGWRTEEDHFCRCTSCGVRLDVSLTDYGMRDAIQTFEECGFSTSLAEDAYEIVEMLERVEYRYDAEDAESREQRSAVVEIARRFLKRPSKRPAATEVTTGLERSL